MCIVGAEPCRAETLDTFGSTFQPLGLRANAISPAYGLAEAALAVTIVPPGAPWHAITRDILSGSGGSEDAQRSPPSPLYVSCGSPLPEYEIVLGEPVDGVSSIEVRGPSMCEGYLTEDGVVEREGDSIETGDNGVLIDGELYVVGRTDDIVHAAGRKLYLVDAERALESQELVLPGRAQAYPFRDGGYGLAIEEDPSALLAGKAMSFAGDIRRRVASTIGVAAREVVLVPRGALRRTASGKPRRRASAHAIETGVVVPWFRREY